MDKSITILQSALKSAEQRRIDVLREYQTIQRHTAGLYRELEATIADYERRIKANDSYQSDQIKATEAALTEIADYTSALERLQAASETP